MLKTSNITELSTEFVRKCVNNYNTIPGPELVQVIMDERNTFGNFKIGVENVKMFIKNNSNELKDIQYELNKIYMETTYNVCHTRGINLTSVKANIKLTVKLDRTRLLSIELDSYTSGVSVVDKTEILMEFVLIYAKGFLRSIKFPSIYQNDFSNVFKKTIEDHFPVNLTELESIRKRDNYDGYLSHFALAKNRTGDTVEKG